MNLAFWLNTAWMWRCHAEARAFSRATRSVEQAQTALLQAILARNVATEFGASHDFDTIVTPQDYQRRVPLSTFEDYDTWIDRIAAGTPHVLTSQRVLLLEPTSGSTSGEKLIPYTKDLRDQFQRGVAAWIVDLMSHRPAVRRGRAYWSVSPALGTNRHSAGGIPIGFDDDTAYLGRPERFLVKRLLAVPSSVARLPDVNGFRYLTLLHLLRASDLALLSIWNPTFLSVLLKQLDPWQEQLCADIRRGTVSHPAASTPSGHHRPDVRRAARLESIFAADRPLSEKLRQIWPRLALISCWTDGPAAWGVPELRALFPSVEIQSKGLLATEAFVSLPLVGRPGAALAIRSHFFEFQEIQSGTIRLAHELDRGGRYRVVVTTGGGLYRYQLRDEVMVTGFEHRCPLLKFLGKSDCVSDLVGEKLGEPHVRQVLERVFSSVGLSPAFSLLVPVVAEPPRYRLYLQGLREESAPGWAASLQRSLEDGLRENPYYRHAVSLGQLVPVEVHQLGDTTEPARDLYERRCMTLGGKLGDIKPSAMDPRPGWEEAFDSATRTA
jgi:hypothetical protein